MEIYLYSTCTSCKKAEKLLKDHGAAYERRDYFRERFSAEDLRSVLERAGLTAHEALSKRSRAYSEHGLADRAPTEGELIDLMVEEPTLLRRPIVIGNGASVVGFNAEQIEALIERS